MGIRGGVGRSRGTVGRMGVNGGVGRSREE